MGLDIGGSSVKVAWFASSGEVHVSQSEGYFDPDRTILRDRLAQALSELPAAVRRDLVAPRIGLCLPGLFDRRARTLSRAVNVPRLVGVDVDGLLAEAMEASGFPRVVGETAVWTDAHAAAHDYVVAHALGGRTLAISLGTGVGACVLDGMTPLHVSGETPGHLGHIDVTLDDASRGPVPRARDGSRGTLEAYIGADALRARFGTADSDSVAAQLSESDPAILALAKALRTAHAIYRPDHVALLGGVGLLLQPLLPRLRVLVNDGLTSLARPGWTLRSADDGFHAARGAARLSGA